MNDKTTRLRCAVAFANLSYEVTVQRMMVESGVVPIIAELSNSYSEDNQLYCAKALLNLLIPEVSIRFARVSALGCVVL